MDNFQVGDFGLGGVTEAFGTSSTTFTEYEVDSGFGSGDFFTQLGDVFSEGSSPLGLGRQIVSFTNSFNGGTASGSNYVRPSLDINDFLSPNSDGPAMAQALRIGNFDSMSGGDGGSGGSGVSSSVSVSQFVSDQSNLDFQDSDFQVADTAANVSSAIDALNNDGNVGAITLTDSSPAALQLNANQAGNDSTALGEITNTNFSIDVTDSAANVAENFDALNATSNINSITLTDSGTPTLDLSVAQALGDTVALGKVTNANFNVAIFDTAADVSANIDAIGADPHVSSITLVDSGTPTLDLSVSEALNDTSVLQEISNSAYAIDISDTAAAILNEASALASDAQIAGIMVVDTAANIIANQTALAANTQVTSIAVEDTAADIITNAATLAANPKVNSIIVIDTAANVLADAGSLQGYGIVVADTAASVASNLDALNGDAGVGAIVLTDSDTPTLTLTVNQALGDTTALGKIQNPNYLVDISDTAANVEASLDVLAKDANLGSIVLTDEGTPTLTITAAQVVNDAAVLAAITNAGVAIVVSDTAANVAANITALDQQTKVSSIVLTDSGTPTLSLTAAQALVDTTALGKIANPSYSISIADTAANVSTVADALNADGKITSITLTDSGSPTLALSAAQARDDADLLQKITNTNYVVNILDTASDILSNEATFGAMPHFWAAIVVDTVSNVIAQEAAIVADAQVQSIVVFDTAANVSASLDVLSANHEISEIILSDSGVPTLNLSVTQTLNDGYAIASIANLNFGIAISDTAANVAANIDLLNAVASISSVTLTDDGTPTLNLSAVQVAADSEVLSAITNQNYTIAVIDSAANVANVAAALAANSQVTSISVVDTAANISANFDALGAVAGLGSITLTDSFSPTLTLSADQTLNDTAELVEIVTPFKIAVVDNATDVLADQAALAADSQVISVEVIDTAANIANNAVALQADGSIRSITVNDTAANIIANESVLAAESQISYVTVIDNAADLLADGAALQADSQVRSIEVVDTATNISADIDALSQMVSGTGIGLTIEGAPTLDLSVAQVVDMGFVSGDFTVDVTDSAANVAANIDELGSAGSITLTDTGTPVLTLSAFQVIDDSSVLDAISNPNYQIAVNDTAADVAANLDALAANGAVEAIALSDSGTPILMLTATQVVSDASALSKISNADYQVDVSDTAANVVANATALQANANVGSIAVADTAANILSNESALAANTQVTSVTVLDTAENVLANEAALSADSQITAIEVADTAANISVNMDALNGPSNLSSITISDFASLKLTAAQIVSDGNALSSLLASNPFYSISVSDSVANILADASALTANGHVNSINVVDNAANVANNLSSLQSIIGFGGTVTIVDTAANIGAVAVTLANSSLAIRYLTASDQATPGPTVILTSPLEDSNLPGQMIAGIAVSSGSATVTGKTVTLTDNGATLGTAIIQADGTFSTFVTLPNEGANSIVAEVTDREGNTGSSVAVIDTLDTIAPTVAITSAAETSAVATQTITGTVTSGGAAPVAGQTVTLLDDGSTLGIATVQADGTFSAAVILNEGTNSIVAKATDSYGNVGNSTAVIDIQNGSVPTTVTITGEVLADDTGASSTDDVTNDGQVTLTGTTNAGSTVTILDGTQIIGDATLFGTDWTFSTNLGAGTHQLVAVATEPDGSTVSSSAAPTVVVDQTIPQPVITSVAQGQNATLLLNGSSEANTVVQVFDGTTLVGSATTDGSGAWSVTTGPMADALHSFTATATDLAGNTGSNNVVVQYGGSGIDTVNVAATLQAGNFAYDQVNGDWDVNSAGGSETLTNVEAVVDSDGDRFLLVGAGSQYATIQEAVNAASDGDTILIAPGTYTENVNIAGKAISLEGFGGATLQGSITESGTLNGALTIDGISIDATGQQYGVLVSANSTNFAGSVTLDNSSISNAELNGFAYIENGNGSTPTLTDTIGSISILNSTFSGNATQTSGANGRGDILLYGYNQDFTVNDVTIENPGAGAQKAIQMRGVQTSANTVDVGPYQASGDISLTDLTVSGNYAQDLLAFYRYADLGSFSTSGVTLNAAAPWGLLNFDEVGGTVDLSSGIYANNLAAGAPVGVEQGLNSNSTFVGAGGSDIFVSNGGNDTLIGGTGNNTYVASSMTGQATIDATAGATNTLDFVGGITDENLWFQQSGNDLQVDLLGTTTQVDVSGWFSGSSNQLQETTAGGLKLDSQVSQLVQAMATYSAANPGFDPTSPSVSSVPNDTNLQTSLAAAWHS